MSKATQTWLEAKYQDWRHGLKRGEDGIQEFADYIGVSKNTVNNWLIRGQTPTATSADLIAARFGPEIYDLIGEPRPDPLLRRLIRDWGIFPDEVKQEIGGAIERAEVRGVIGESDSGVEVPKPRRKGRT